jgi:hypothetical protein
MGSWRFDRACQQELVGDFEIDIDSGDTPLLSFAKYQ